MCDRLSIRTFSMQNCTWIETKLLVCTRRLGEIQISNNSCIYRIIDSCRHEIVSKFRFCKITLSHQQCIFLFSSRHLLRHRAWNIITVFAKHNNRLSRFYLRRTKENRSPNRYLSPLIMLFQLYDPSLVREPEQTNDILTLLPIIMSIVFRHMSLWLHRYDAYYIPYDYRYCIG